jgi:hypothetical protein
LSLRIIGMTERFCFVLRLATAACAASLLGVASAHAGIPTPPYWGAGTTVSTCPSVIRIVGMTGGVADTTLGRTIVRVGRFLNPVASSGVVIDFSQAPQVQLASDQPWNITWDGRPSANCAARTVLAITDINGYADVVIAGGITNLTSGPAPIAKVYADGVFWGDVPVVAYDVDGRNGLGAGDLSLWLSAFGSGLDYGMLDYDQDGKLGAGDLSLWLDAFGSGRNAESAAQTCP